MIQKRIPFQSRNNSQRYSCQNGDQHCNNSEFQGGWKTSDEILKNLSARIEALAQITSRKLPKVKGQLNI